MPDEVSPEPELVPPDVRRVVLRSFCLSAIVCRSFIDENPEHEDYQDVHQRIIPWLESTGATAELEAWEAEALAVPLGALQMQTRVNGTWLSEGLAVLAWALGRFDLPPHDVAVDPLQLTNALQFLQDDAPALIDSASLRPRDEIEEGADQAFAIHWRIRQFTLTREAMDFSEFAKTAWFGPLDIEGVALADSDLSVNGKPIGNASEDEVRGVNSIAMERHRAFNWLEGYDEIFSEVDTST